MHGEFLGRERKRVECVYNVSETRMVLQGIGSHTGYDFFFYLSFIRALVESWVVVSLSLFLLALSDQRNLPINGGPPGARWSDRADGDAGRAGLGIQCQCVIRSCVLFARISRSGPRWTGHKFSLRPNTHFHCLLEQRISQLLANVIYSVNLFNQEKNISIS